MTSQRYVTIPRESLVTRRPAVVRKLLTPLARAVDTDAGWADGGWVIAAAGGKRNEVLDYRDRTFETQVPRFEANYYERWQEYDAKGRAYYLERMYFHLYGVRDRHGDRLPVIALHCDPAPANVADMSEYALSTHVHVSAAAYPINRAHICLEIERLSAICGSIAELTRSVERGLMLIKHEVLDHADVSRLVA